MELEEKMDLVKDLVDNYERGVMREFDVNKQQEYMNYSFMERNKMDGNKLKYGSELSELDTFYMNQTQILDDKMGLFMENKRYMDETEINYGNILNNIGTMEIKETTSNSSSTNMTPEEFNAMFERQRLVYNDTSSSIKSSMMGGWESSFEMLSKNELMDGARKDSRLSETELEKFMKSREL
jgi:hypothetical protein